MPAAGRAPMKGAGVAGRPGVAGAGKGAVAPKGPPAKATSAPKAPATAPTTKRPFGMFGNLGSVQGPSGGGNWLKDGRYYLMVNKFTADVSKQNRGEFCAAEMTVLQHVVAFENSNAVGERVSAVFMANTPNNMGVINLKGFLGACTGMDANATSPEQNGYASGEEWEEAATRAADGDGTLLSGTILDVTATTIKTRAQKDFTKVTYVGVDEETANAVLAAFNGGAAE